MAADAAAASPAASAVPAAQRAALGEDWIAVCCGAAGILLVLAGVQPPLPRFAWTAAADLGAVLGPGNLWRMAAVGALVLLPAAAGAAALGARPGRFIAGAGTLYGLAVAAQAAAGHTAASALGLEYVLFALLIGIAINHLILVPAWLAEAVRTEFYIKTGLVLLGASILFNEIVRAGALGLVQAVIVVVAVWFFCFWLCRRLRVDDEFAAILSSAVAICGVSAAIAACGAIQGDRKKLSYVTSLVLVVAVPMMVVMPWAAAATGMPDAVAGAWLGGTLDTSAAVVAAGELVSDRARDTAVVVKLSQNALIGVAALLLTLWWALRQGGPKMEGSTGSRLAVIWDRFPKFVLGFLAVSLVFSFALAPSVVAETRGGLGALRTAWFAMAFVSIGLETSLAGLVTTGNGRPAAAFAGSQAFNVAITLVVAYALFGGME